MNASVPHDIKFVFVLEKKEISAHKVVLAIASDVFKTEFFGHLREPKDSVEIVDVCYAVFKEMIEFIYNINHCWWQRSIQFLGELYYLGEKYMLGSLKVKILESIQYSVPSTRSVVRMSLLADHYAFLEEFSDLLYELVMQCVEEEFKANYKVAMECFSEAKRYEAGMRVWSKLMIKLMSRPNKDVNESIISMFRASILDY